MSARTPRIHTLALRDLGVSFPAAGGDVRAVIDGVDLELRRGSAVSLLGVSGAGKTVVSRLLQGLAPAGARVRGSLRVDGPDGPQRFDLSRDLAGRPPAVAAMARHWGRAIASVHQGGTRNLNPALTIGRQMRRARRRAGAPPDRDADLELLRRMDLEDPRRVLSRRPAALSEGMARRVLLALALAGTPDIVILDEPTTGLDSARRRQIIDLIARARRELGFGMLMVTHEVGDAAALTDVAAVLSGGRLVERLDLGGGGVRGEPVHPAARALVDAWRWTGWSAGGRGAPGGGGGRSGEAPA